MKDTIIKGTGNSRSIKSVSNLAQLAPTYDKLLALLIGQGLPVDIGPLNAAGVDTRGTELNKGNILSDATAALYGRDNTAVPNDIFSDLAQALNGGFCEAITSSKTWVAPFDMNALICCIGGGGGGGIGSGGRNTGSGGGGGGSGYINCALSKLSKGEAVNITIGEGGTGGVYSSAVSSSGGTTSFGTYVSALGGTPGESGDDGSDGNPFATSPGIGAFIGEYGCAGSGNYGGTGGNGASSGFGTGGGGGQGGHDRRYEPDSSPSAGGDAVGFGCGGGGGGGVGWGSASMPGGNGGNGSSGIVIILYVKA